MVHETEVSEAAEVEAIETEAEPTAYTKAEQAHYEEIRAKEREVGVLASKAEDAKIRASAAKKRAEAEHQELCDLIRQGPDLQQKLPGMEGDKADSDEWKAEPIQVLDLPTAILNALRETDLYNLAELSAFMADHGTQWWRHIKDIGEAKGEQISEAFIAFWGAYPEYCQPEEEEDEEEAEEIRNS